MLAIPMTKIAGRGVVVIGACAMVVAQATVVFAASSTPVPAPAVYNCTCTLVRDMDLAGPNVFEPGRRGVVSPGACCALCQSYGNCSGFTWMNDAPPYDNYCSLKTAGVNHTGRHSDGHVSGFRQGVPVPPAPGPPPPVKKPMGLFMKGSWASEVPEAQLDAWFGLVAKGRAEGPESPFYVSEFGIQQIASGGSGHAFPVGLPAGTLMLKEIALLSKYFHLFDRVYIGTAVTNYSRNCRGVPCKDYAALETQVATDFLKLYPLSKHPNLAWYVTEEGCLESPAGLAELLYTSVSALRAVAPLPVLWSPGFCRKFDTLPANGTLLEAQLTAMICSSNLSAPIAIHHQDLCGQTATFEFPFYYNYEGALNSTDGLSYYHMMQRVRQKCPDKLTEAKINMEMFIEHRNPGATPTG